MWKAYPRHSVNLSWGCYLAASRTVVSGKILKGAQVQRFEEQFAEFIGVRHALGVSSGRAALYLAFQSLGFAPGDEIIMPAYTFHIVPLVISACGLKPVFVDVLPDTYNIDVSQIPQKITGRTRAILATHMYGQPCDLAPIRSLADAHGLKVIEDCAHALGALYEGRRAGAFGDLAAFTFAMAKNMPCFGGGMLTTNDSDLYGRLLSLIRPPDSGRLKSLAKEIAGTTVNFIATRPLVFSYLVYPMIRAASALGSGFFDREPGQEKVSSAEVSAVYATRLTNLQAAVGLHQLTRIEKINARVNRNAQIYNSQIKNRPAIKTPRLQPGRTHTFLYYRIEAANRKALRSALLRKGIDTVQDDMSNCLTLAPFRHEKADLRVAADLPQRILEIPNNPGLTEKDVRTIAQCINDAA
jgi:dTDP-4-amino-4,6-dideoxygalactose transaminase